MNKKPKSATDEDQANGLPVEANPTATDSPSQDTPMADAIEIGPEPEPEPAGTVYAVFAINQHMTLGLWRLLDNQLPDEGLELPEADCPPSCDTYMRVANEQDLAMARDLIKTR